MKRVPLNSGLGGHVPANGYADPAPRTRPRRTSTLEVPCPDCVADVREPCVTAKGTTTRTSHVSRIRMATRLDNERREAAGTFTAKDPLERTPGSREDPGGTYCPTCTLTIRMTTDRSGWRVLVQHTSEGKAPSHEHPACPGSRVRPKDLSA